MNTFFLISLFGVCFLLSAIVLVVIYYRSFNKVVILLSFICLQLFLWSGIHVIAHFITDPVLMIYLSRWSLTAVIFFPATFLHFVYVFTKTEISKIRELNIYVIAWVLFPFSFTSYTASYFIHGNPNYDEINLGPVYYLFLPYAFAFFGYTLFLLIQEYRNPNNSVRYRTQLRYITTGFSVTFLFGFWNNIILPVFFNQYVSTLYGPLSVYVLGLFMLYAIVRLRLFNIRIIVQKRIFQLTLFSLFTLMYYLAVSSVYFFVLRNIVGTKEIIAYFLLSVFVFTFFFHLFSLFVTKLMNNLFMRETLDFSKYISERDFLLNSTHELESFLLKYAGMIQEAVEAPVVSVYVQQKHMSRFVEFFPKKKTNRYYLFDSEFVDELQGLPMILTVGKIEEEYSHTTLPKIMQKMNAKMLFLVQSNTLPFINSTLGIFFIGRHKNNMPFKREHIEKLKELHDFGQEILPIVLRWQMSVDYTKIQSDRYSR